MGKLLTKAYKNHMSDLMIDSIFETAPSAYYVINGPSEYSSYFMFASKHVDRIGAKETPIDRVRDTLTEPYHEMIFGKRITTNDIAPVIRNIPYTSNKVYTMYDDSDSTMFANDFYCVVDESSFKHVYKCLDNNLGAQSTVEPSFSHVVGSNTTIYQTSDGYRWKYMYSINEINYDKFATDAYVPVVANSDVSNAAVDGSIEIIKIVVEGKNYNNYTNGSFSASQLRIGGNTNLYEIANSSLNTTNGYYTDCIIYLSSGTGSGQYRTITNYYSNGTGNYIVVNSEFSTPPENGTVYEINPQVVVNGDGIQTTNVVARALVNALSTNSIYRIECLNVGAGYRYATANVKANSVVGVSLTAEVRPIFTPPGGHGANASIELGASGFAIGVTFSNNESNTILATNSYDQIGIIKNPKFANVLIRHSGANGIFSAGELVHKITPVRIQEGATINTTSSIVSCNGGDFANQIANGDTLYLQSGNGSSFQHATVNVVTNSSTFTMTVNGLFSCTDVDIYFANQSTNAYVTSTPNNDHMFVTNVYGVFNTGDIVIGAASGARIIVETTFRNGLEKNYNTFVQLYKYVGSITAGGFQNDEIVYQGDTLATSTANGYLHSITESNTIFWVSNLVGNVATTATLKGETSGGAATITNKYDPELVYGSGEILYLENIDTVNRTNLQSESLKLVFEF